MSAAHLACTTVVRAEYAVPGCAGKQRFESPALASEVAARSQRGPRTHYRCRHCGYFHVGGVNALKAKRVNEGVGS